MSIAASEDVLSEAVKERRRGVQEDQENDFLATEMSLCLQNFDYFAVGARLPPYLIGCFSTIISLHFLIAPSLVSSSRPGTDAGTAASPMVPTSLSSCAYTEQSAAVGASPPHLSLIHI